MLVRWRLAWAAETATILVQDLNVRSGPGNSHAVVFKLAEKSRVRVLSRSQEWLKIDFQRPARVHPG